MKEVGGTVLDIFKKKKTWNRNNCFILTKYELYGGTNNMKYLNIH